MSKAGKPTKASKSPGKTPPKPAGKSAKATAPKTRTKPASVTKPAKAAPVVTAPEVVMDIPVDKPIPDIVREVLKATKSTPVKPVEPKDPNDRRAEKRRPTRQPGMVYVEGAAWEVEMLDVSPDGVGFLSVAAIDSRVMVHLKIGIGPTRQSRGIRIIRCTRTPDGMYNIGAEYL